VDALPEGGTITMRTRLADRRAADGRSAPDHRVCVEVSDTGVGMDEETMRRCLEPFFTTKGERGTGLGLAMVYGTVQRHGAEIEIDSALGRGTTIRLLFPLPASAVELPPAVAAARMPPRLHLLVVDDDAALLKSLTETLQDDGHEVVAAAGGQAGIDVFLAVHKAGRPFSAVITDLGMPQVDGRQVAAAVKAASPRTTVLLLTGWGQRLTEEGEVPPNVDRVLSKPPKLGELREALALAATPPT
jgi:CheY-like chemotaxis protein